MEEPDDSAIDRDDEAPGAVDYPGVGGGAGRITTPAGDLHYLRASGNLEEMLGAQGTAFADLARLGAREYLRGFIDDVGESSLPSVASKLGRMATRGVVLKKLRASLPRSYRAGLSAFARGAGQEVEQVLNEQLLIDLWGGLGRGSLMPKAKVAQTDRRHLPWLASSSVILPGHGGPLHLRWLDNSSVGLWDRATTVTFYRPSRGLEFALVGSAGFVLGLPAGMNSAGLTLTVEPAGEGGVQWSGEPLGPAVFEILSDAHTIDEAGALLRQHPALSNWRYIFCEGDTGAAAEWLVGPKGVRCVRRGSGAFSVNGDDLGLPGGHLPRIARWQEARKQALNQLLIDWSTEGDGEVGRALEILNRPVDGAGVVPIHPLSGISNVGALIFEPRRRRLWVAAGAAPAGRRYFVPLSLSSRAAGGVLARGVDPVEGAPGWSATACGQAARQLYQALEMERSGESPRRILIALEHALALDSSQAPVHLLVGLMALRAGRGRRAEGAFADALKLVEDPVRCAEIKVYLGWAMDVQKRRLAARKYYGEAGANADLAPALRRWIRRFRRRRFRPLKAYEMEIDFFAAAAFWP